MSTLHPEHLIDLRRSRLEDATIEHAGIESIRPHDIARELGQEAPHVSSAYRIPCPGTPFYRCRLFPPYKDKDGKTVKYLQKKGTAPRLYIPSLVQSMLGDPSVPLWIAEGEKKALRAAQDGLCCVGVGGC